MMYSAQLQFNQQTLVGKTRKKYYNNNNNNQQKKRTCKIVNFAVPADHRVKLKECEKKGEYLDLAR